MTKRGVISSSIISVILVGLVVVGSTSALEYQTNPSSGDNPVTLKFEFGQTLTISTGGNISIASLTPGTKAISSSNYNVTVSTNNLTGYTLSATVGCSSGTNCYDNKNLSDGTNNFTMLSSDGTLTSGTWGVSLDSSATENSSFKTLAKYDETATILNKTTSNTGTAATGYTGTENTTFRIGAYAANSQVAGTYTNSINFIAVANIIPSVYMQEQTAESLAMLMPNIGDEVILRDKRDEKSYTVAHLADDNYWMTQNLDHDIDHTFNYNSSNTDIPTGWNDTLPDTKTTDDTTWDKSSNKSFVAQSYDPGDLCWNGALSSNAQYLSCGDDKHYHIGNFYSWTVAVAMSDSSNYTTDNIDVNQSICPAGWRLPLGGTTNTNTGSRSFSNLMSYYNYNESSLKNAPFYGVYDGIWTGNYTNYRGSFSIYLSSVVNSSDTAYSLSANNLDDIFNNGTGGSIRYAGFFVRCVAR